MSDPVGHITSHFEWPDFACRTGAAVPMDLQPNIRRLCGTVLEPLRARYGKPIVVICGYRTPTYNQALRDLAIKEGRHTGVALDSQHCYGKAADIRPVERADLAYLRHLIETMLAAGELPGLGGWGPYLSWVHVDVRDKPPSGHVAHWIGAGAGTET